MPLDRTWFNALVDDDGSGVTGSVWDKADIKNLLDSVDMELARLDATAVPGANFWVPTLGASGGGTPIYTIQNGFYTKVARAILLSGNITISSKGSLSGYLRLGGLPFPCGTVTGRGGGLLVPYVAGLSINASMVSGFLNFGQDFWTLTYMPSPGTTGMTYLMDTNIANNLDIGFAGIYFSPS